MVVWLTPKGSTEVTCNTAVPAMEPAFRSPSPSSSMTDELGKHLRTRELTKAAPSLGNKRSKWHLLGALCDQKERSGDCQDHCSRLYSEPTLAIPCAVCSFVPQAEDCLWIMLLSLKIKSYHMLIIWKTVGKKNWKQDSNKSLYMNVHSGTSHSSQKVKMIKMFTDGWTNCGPSIQWNII